jgi:hypothetical protein
MKENRISIEMENLNRIEKWFRKSTAVKMAMTIFLKILLMMSNKPLAEERQEFEISLLMPQREFTIEKMEEVEVKHLIAWDFVDDLKQDLCTSKPRK